jgi:glycosyltransferase involved in cell wall biosynthesis
MGATMRVLCVLSASNQMYSGIGRAVFEFCRRLSGRVVFEFAISEGPEKNLNPVRVFCREQGIPLHVGRGRLHDDALDLGNGDLAQLLQERRWDVVECLCWANAATNQSVLENLGDIMLAYTPHHQPTWTVPMSPVQADRTEAVHQRMLERADVVFCDSPWERRELQARVPRSNNCAHLSLGCDFGRFEPGPTKRREQLLFVGDLAEPRKRFDRVLSVFARLVQVQPWLRLVVVGNRSEDATGLIPGGLRHACSILGYVSEEELRSAYRDSLGLFLLSDFEAFGIPILEALASGTPVFLSRQAATESLFHGYRGANFCPADDLEATLTVVTDVLDRVSEEIAETIGDRARLRAAFDWDHLSRRKWDALCAAWFARGAWLRTA